MGGESTIVGRGLRPVLGRSETLPYSDSSSFSLNRDTAAGWKEPLTGLCHGEERSDVAIHLGCVFTLKEFIERWNPMSHRA